MSGENMSHNSTSSRDGEEMTSTALQVTAYCVIMVVSIAGNLLVIITYRRDKNELKKQVMGATICHMALADLMTSVVGIPAMITVILCNQQWLISGSFGVAICKLHSFAIEVGFSVSALSISVIAVERFLSVFHPLRKILTVKTAHVISAVVWVFACCFYGPRLYSTDVFKQGYKLYCVSKPQEIQTWREIEACLYSILFLVTLILYIAIVVKVTCRNSIPGRVITETSQIARNRTNRRVIRQGLGVITIHYLCWLPYLWIYVTCVVFQLNIINVCKDLGMFHHFGIFFLGYSNAALNPILYTATNESFRKGCQNAIRTACGARMHVAPTRTSSVRNSRNCSDVQTKRQNGETQTENVVDPSHLYNPINGVESVALRDGTQQSRQDSPRVIIVSSSQ